MRDPHDPTPPAGDSCRYDWSVLDTGMNMNQATDLFHRLTTAVGHAPTDRHRQALLQAVTFHEPVRADAMAECGCCLDVAYPCAEIREIADALAVAPCSADPMLNHPVAR